MSIMARKQLLVLSHRLPYPPHNGAAIRTYNLLRQLAVDFDIVALCFDRRDHALRHIPIETRVDALAPYARCRVFPIEQLESRSRLVWDHARSVASSQPYVIPMHASRGFEQALREELAATSFDLVHLDSFDLMGYLPMVQHLPTTCTHHNAESALLQRRADREGGLRARYIRHQAVLLARAETALLPRFDLNLTVSDVDAQILQEKSPAARFAVVPNGVDSTFFQPRVNGLHNGCVFVGGTTWFPNRDGLEWFAGEVLPLMHAAGLRDQVTWVGRVTDVERREFARPGLSFTGYVDDIRPHVQSAACFIAPLRVGGGTRLKILDAWSMGAPVVATRVACEGLEAVDGGNILIADSADDFVGAIGRVIGDPELAARLGAGGRAVVERIYSWDVVGARLRDMYRNLIARRQPRH